MFFDLPIEAGNWIIDLPENETVEIEVTPKGLDFTGIATWKDNGRTKNVVECDYRSEHTTMYDLLDDMVVLTTFGTSRVLDGELRID